jgi:hypothetical protein
MARTRLLAAPGMEDALESNVESMCRESHGDSLSGIRKSQHSCGASLLRKDVTADQD